jgi:hypothetical protein
VKLQLAEDCPFDGIAANNARMAAMTEDLRLKRLKEARNEADSWKEWYRLTPLERMRESMKLWQFYLQAGGSLDPEPDSQSPFDSVMPRSTAPAYGRPGLRVVRRSGV